MSLLLLMLWWMLDAGVVVAVVAAVVVVVVVFVVAVFLRFSSKQDILNFRVMAVRDIKLRSRLSKNTHLSHDF